MPRLRSVTLLIIHLRLRAIQTRSSRPSISTIVAIPDWRSGQLACKSFPRSRNLDCKLLSYDACLGHLDFLQPADASVIVATHVSDWDNDLVVLETRQLASIHIYPLRGTFIPLSKDALRSRHLDEDNLGPDFIHRVHTPRIDALPEWLDVEDHLEDTAPHLNRLYDLLVMSTLGWPDVNLFIASAFSSFSEYSVQWFVHFNVFTVTRRQCLQSSLGTRRFDTRML